MVLQTPSSPARPAQLARHGSQGSRLLSLCLVAIVTLLGGCTATKFQPAVVEVYSRSLGEPLEGVSVSLRVTGAKGNVVTGPALTNNSGRAWIQIPRSDLPAEIELDFPWWDRQYGPAPWTRDLARAFAARGSFDVDNPNRPTTRVDGDVLVRFHPVPEVP